jgi:hypothetical protein
MFASSVDAQQRVVDAETGQPVEMASIFDVTGNVVGYTMNGGIFSEVSESDYPITLRCLGYEPLVIQRPEEKTWKMTPLTYDMKEVVIVPVKRNVLKQTIYAREYFSVSNATDTVNLFLEHMGVRFLPTTKDAKFGGNSSLRILTTNQYSHYQVHDKDSFMIDHKSTFPSFLNLILSKDEVKVPDSFMKDNNEVKVYKKTGKSGLILSIKQNAHTFTCIKDGLADTKDHKMSPWELKVLGATMDINQLYRTGVFKVNDKGVYHPKDLIEASFVLEADGRGKFLRKMLKSETPVVIRSMVELYVVDREYLSNEEAKEEYKNKSQKIDFIIPSTVPPLNDATLQLIKRAKLEVKK